jgi:hypothetical protein
LSVQRKKEATYEEKVKQLAGNKRVSAVWLVIVVTLLWRRVLCVVIICVQAMIINALLLRSVLHG